VPYTTAAPSRVKGVMGVMAMGAGEGPPTLARAPPSRHPGVTTSSILTGLSPEPEGDGVHSPSSPVAVLPLAWEVPVASPGSPGSPGPPAQPRHPITSPGPPGTSVSRRYGVRAVKPLGNMRTAASSSTVGRMTTCPFTCQLAGVPTWFGRVGSGVGWSGVGGGGQCKCCRTW
jgi:hypothetical protein